MKKILILLFIIIYAAASFAATLSDKKAELSRVKRYIRSLDAKIVAARSARKINKLAELKDLKRRQLGRAKLIRKDIAGLEKGEKKPGTKVSGKKLLKDEWKRGWQVEGGYEGGAGIFEVGYVISVAAVDVLIGAGYGIGNNYSIVTGSVAGVFPFGNNYAGLELGLASYSETVSDVLGVSGNIAKGSRTGIGIFGGTKLGMVDAQIGYNTALGLTAGVVYKF